MGNSDWSEDLNRLLTCTPLQALTENKESELAEVPYTATVAETLRILHDHSLSAAPVLSSASSSDVTSCSNELDANMLPECYISIVSTSDILTYFGKLLQSQTMDSDAVTQMLLESPIHCCIESKGLCMMNPNSSVLEAIDEMINGMRHALIPHITHKRIRCVGERTMCKGFSIITRLDIIRFIQVQSAKFEPLLRHSVGSLQVFHPTVYGLSGEVSVMDAIRYMHEGSLSLVPVLEEDGVRSTQGLLKANGKVVVGTFSAKDLEKLSTDAFRKWAGLGILSFLKRIAMMEMFQLTVEALERDQDALYNMDFAGSYFHFSFVSCTLESSLEDVINKVLKYNVHKVWVVEKDCVLQGLICCEDILKAVRRCLLD